MTREREPEPSRDELQAMAYVDGELALEERREFELVLAQRADLRREVVRLQRLNLLTRHVAGPEPMDHEWRALELDALQRAGFGVGFALLGTGALALGAVALYLLWTSVAPLVLKLAVSALFGGFALVFLVTLRARMRTRHLDPYSEIER